VACLAWAGAVSLLVAAGLEKLSGAAMAVGLTIVAGLAYLLPKCLNWLGRRRELRRLRTRVREDFAWAVSEWEAKARKRLQDLPRRLTPLVVEQFQLLDLVKRMLSCAWEAELCATAIDRTREHVSFNCDNCGEIPTSAGNHYVCRKCGQNISSPTLFQDYAAVLPGWFRRLWKQYRKRRLANGHTRCGHCGDFGLVHQGKREEWTQRQASAYPANFTGRINPDMYKFVSVKSIYDVHRCVSCGTELSNLLSHERV
jgi:hypothetical protein